MWYLARPFTGRAPHVLDKHDHIARALCGASFGPRTAFNGWASVEPLSPEHMPELCTRCRQRLEATG